VQLGLFAWILQQGVGQATHGGSLVPLAAAALTALKQQLVSNAQHAPSQLERTAWGVACGPLCHVSCCA
jgi:hypothetical protein